MDVGKGMFVLTRDRNDFFFKMPRPKAGTVSSREPSDEEVRRVGDFKISHVGIGLHLSHVRVWLAVAEVHYPHALRRVRFVAHASGWYSLSSP